MPLGKALKYSSVWNNQGFGVERILIVSCPTSILLKRKIKNNNKTTSRLLYRNQHSTMEYLELDGEKYAVVGTVLILLKMVSEYCK